MWEVSQKWVDNQLENFSATPQVELSVSLIENKYFPTEIQNSFKKLVRLDFAATVTDGVYSFAESDEELDDILYISEEVSGENQSSQKRIFTAPQIFTINNIDYTNEPKGITVVFSKQYDEYPFDFIVRRKQSSGNFSHGQTINNNLQNTVYVEFDKISPEQQYDTIEIEIQNWCLPYHHARIEAVIPGQTYYYTNNEIISYSTTNDGDYYSFRAPSLNLNATCYDKNGIFDPENTTTNGAFRVKNTCGFLSARYGYIYEDGSEEWIPGAFAIIENIEYIASKKQVRFTGVAVTELLSEPMITIPQPDVQITSIAINLQTEINKVLEQFGSKITINRSTKNPAWQDNTHSVLDPGSLGECLQVVANIAGAYILNRRDGVVVVDSPREEPLPSVYPWFSPVLNPYYMYSLPDVQKNKSVKIVTIKSKSRYKSNEKKEQYNSERIFDKAGQYRIILPHENAVSTEDFEDTTEVKTGFSIISVLHYTWYSIYNVNIANPSGVSITFSGAGYTLESSERMETLNIKDFGSESSVENELSTGLVSISYEDFIKSYFSRDYEISISMRIDPRIDLYDVVEVELDKETKVTIIITSIQLQFNGAFRGSIKGVILNGLD